MGALTVPRRVPGGAELAAAGYLAQHRAARRPAGNLQCHAAHLLADNVMGKGRCEEPSSGKEFPSKGGTP